MNKPFLLAALLALPLAATAQTKPASPNPATRQVTEVTEELDPATGQVVRRTTRTYTEPLGPSSTVASSTAEAPSGKATDKQVTDFFREKTAVSNLSVPALVEAYSRLMDKVRDERRKWKPADWEAAANVLSSLNQRYDQLRADISFEDKLTIRSQQAEFQGLRTARQLSESITDKL